jgi:hypothetical protein
LVDYVKRIFVSGVFVPKSRNFAPLYTLHRQILRKKHGKLADANDSSVGVK